MDSSSIQIKVSLLERDSAITILTKDLEGLGGYLSRYDEFYRKFYDFQKNMLETRLRLGVEGYNQAKFEGDAALIRRQELEWEKEKARVQEGINALSSLKAKFEGTAAETV